MSKVKYIEKNKEIPFSKIVVDQGIYPRSSTREEHIGELREILDSGKEFYSNIVVAEPNDKDEYILIDGNHRYHTYRQKEIDTVRVDMINTTGFPLLYWATITNKRSELPLETEEKKDVGVRLWKSGMKVEDIVEAVGRTQRTVYMWLKPSIEQQKKEFTDRVKKLSEQGMMQEEIVEKTGIPQQTVSYILSQSAEKLQKLVKKPSENGTKSAIPTFATVAKVGKDDSKETNPELNPVGGEGLEKTLTLEQEVENLLEQFSTSVDESNTYFGDIFNNIATLNRKAGHQGKKIDWLGKAKEMNIPEKMVEITNSLKKISRSICGKEVSKEVSLIEKGGADPRVRTLVSWYKELWNNKPPELLNGQNAWGQIGKVFKNLISGFSNFTDDPMAKIKELYLFYKNHQSNGNKYLFNEDRSIVAFSVRKMELKTLYEKEEGEKDIELISGDDVDEISIELAEMLLNAMRKNKPDFKQPDMDGWAKEMHVILYEDKREPNAVADVINYAQGDNIPRDGGFCWAYVILSPWVLRKHFDRLQMEMEKRKNMTGISFKTANSLRAAQEALRKFNEGKFDDIFLNK